MTHLKIEQNNGIAEQVSPSVIEKLYEIVHSGNLDSSSNLMGSLNTTGTYQNYVDYLEEQFTKNGIRQLIITANKLYISFADPAVLSRMLQYLGDGVGITSSEITNGNWYSNTTDPNTNSALFTNNTSITSFNELGQLSQITNIPNNTFKGCTNLTNINLHNITSIGQNAFQDCSALSSVDLSNCTSIGANAFNACILLSSVNLSNVTSLGNLVFRGCSSLISVGDLSNITTIGSNVFQNCSALTSVDLSNITTIGNNAFTGCTSLTTIGNLSNCTSIQFDAFSGCSSLTSVGDLSNITTIGSAVFKNCSKLTSVDLSNCTSIGKEAFYSCSTLTTIDLSNVTSIGQDAFKYCSALTSIGDLSNCTSLGGGAFQNCSSLTTIGTLNSSITSIPYSCFRDCTSLTTFDFSNITSVGDNAFNNCTSLGTGQTLDLNLSNQTSHPEYAFRGTKYSKLILHCPQLTRTMDPRNPIWYAMPNVTYIDLSDFLIAKNSFDNSQYMCPGPEGDTSIVTFIYPSNVTDIGSTLRFGRYYNTYRYTIILATTPPGLEITDHNNPPSTWFNNSNLHIYVPDSAKATYLADTNWASIGGYNGSDTIVDRLHGLSELPAGIWTTGLAASKYHFFNDPEVTRILTLAYAVEDGVALTNSDIASIISNDGYTDDTFSFKNNTDLVDFSDLNKLTNVTWLNYEAFDGCTSLQNINLSNIVNLSYTGGMIENYTFRNCSSLEYIYLPNATGSSLYEQCQGCTSLKLYIAPNVTGIGRLNGPFVNCLNLKGIFIPKCNMGGSSADQWHEDAFIGGCGNVKVVDVDIITSINEHTFRYNTSLSAVIFRNTTTVPTLTGETSSYFSNITFYVDDNMLSTYQADSAWSNANIHLDVISNFVLADHLDSDTLTLYNSIVNPS